MTSGEMYRPSLEGTRDAPRALVFREDFLALSETFIRDHLADMPRYRVAALAGSLSDPTLPVPGVPVHLLRSTSFVGRARQFAGYRLGVPQSRMITVAAREVLRTLRPDVLHAHFGPDAALVSAAAAGAGVPLVATFHGYDATQGLDSLRGGRISNDLLVDHWAAVISRLSAVITVSGFLRQCLLARGVPDEKIEVIPCGVQTSAIAWSPPPADGPIVFVGRLVEKKGVSDLLHAVALVESPPRVDIVGDGPLASELRALAAGLRIDVRFLGALPTAEVIATMCTGRMVAMPSKTASNGDSEGLGVVALEASAAGRPVVGYRHGGLPDAVLDGHTGTLVEEGDVSGLAAAIRSMSSDPDQRLRYAVAGRAHVEANFERSVLLDRVADVYDRVIGRSTVGEPG